MTRFDNLQKHLTPELLAKMVGDATFDCEECPAKENCTSENQCSDSFLQWLKKEG